MPLIFSHGTLRQDDIQLAVFGRLLKGRNDELVGFEQALVRIEDPAVVASSGKSYYSNVVFNGKPQSRISGMVYEVTDAELAAADRYEQGAAYTRVTATTSTGGQAWVYVDAATLRK
jgi:gamma-glutamylcyclotransferase (GGCT)/AIG2-like uncharacterized protein YtfP